MGGGEGWAGTQRRAVSGLSWPIRLVKCTQSHCQPPLATSMCRAHAHCVRPPFVLQVFLICVNRARQMQHLTPQQLPRGGVWSATSSTSLRQLEAYCLKPQSNADGAAPPPAAAAGGTVDVGASNGGSGGSRSSGTAASGSSRRRAGSAAVSGVGAAGRNAAAGSTQGPVDAAYDEDGLR